MADHLSRAIRTARLLWRGGTLPCSGAEGGAPLSMATVEHAQLQALRPDVAGVPSVAAGHVDSGDPAAGREADWEERAAILEYGAGLSRRVAEAWATAEVQGTIKGDC
jgi:hypothetical protein